MFRRYPVASLLSHDVPEDDITDTTKSGRYTQMIMLAIRSGTSSLLILRLSEATIVRSSPVDAAAHTNASKECSQSRGFEDALVLVSLHRPRIRLSMYAVEEEACGNQVHGC